MSEVTDTVGAAEMIEALGQAWTLSHVGPGVRAKYSAECKMYARREIAGMRQLSTSAEYEEQLTAFNRQLAAGEFSWGSPLDPEGVGAAVGAALAGTEGNLRLIRLLLHKEHGDVPPEKVAAIFYDAPEQVRLALRACLGQADPNPTPPSPSGETRGTGTTAPTA